MMRILLLFFLIPVCSLFAQTNRDALWNYNTGRDLERNGRMSEAETLYAAAIQITNDEISRNVATRDSYTVLTWSLLRLRRYQDVISWGERGLRLYADEFRIVETMGQAYFYLGDYDQSLRFMQRYVNSSPEGDRVPFAYFFIGEVHRLRSQFHHADIAYTTALRFQPGNSLWWYRLGLVHEALRDFPQARAAFSRALDLNFDFPEARAALVRSYR